ncbi:MAG: efflux RND transporter periplasmic adaptor subunit [Gammaproteobacteria bacterium]|nr:efflux RND transporter periplasmic adaptor subunit [Gammaproteobacteria bacterium]
MVSLNMRWPSTDYVVTSLLICVCLYATFTARAWAADTEGTGIMTVHTETLAPTLRAYGQVEAIAVIPVRTIYPGTLRDLSVVPGDAVNAGEILARIAGPRMQSLLTRREQALRSEQAREKSASRALAILRSKFKMQLATQQAINVAESDLATAHAAVQTASVQLQEARNLQVVRAPAAGTVLAVHASNGVQATADQALITLLPTGKLWLRASYYGADVARLHVGMKGRFQPADGSEAIPVKVTAIASSVSPDGGYHVGLLPVSSDLPKSWVNGQWGKVTLEGAAQTMIPVPTAALILDRGRWWVLVHTPQGDKPQQVMPGPTQGWQTWIASGLHAGERIVVEDAFLKYHRGIARAYQPPD